MKLGILGTGMIVREFLPWLAGPDCPFTVQALCSTQRCTGGRRDVRTVRHSPAHHELF